MQTLEGGGSSELVVAIPAPPCGAAHSENAKVYLPETFHILSRCTCGSSNHATSQ
jgi:hypothetical protein